MQVRSYPIRHKIFSFLRDLDVRGVRRLSVALPKILLPKPATVGRHILKTPDGIKLIIDPVNDHGVELSLHETGTYEKGILNYIRENFRNDGVFVDVGANIGLMSLFVSRYFPLANIHAFEAHPETAVILRENLSLNSFSNNITVHSVALGSERSTVSISADLDANRGGASIVKEGQQPISVECFTMDEVLAESKVDLIKIDVEGYELHVLQGAKKIIESQHPVLIIEISQDRDGTDQTKAIWNFVQEMGFVVFKFKGTKERKSNLIKVSSFDQLPEHDNVICVFKPYIS